MAVWILAVARSSPVAEAIKLHPDNPHYFLFRGRPTVLITSGEHYGAVLNRDFDYITYLNELQSKGLNLTRTFSGGPYREIPASFNIAKNTLAPAPNRFSCVWAESSTPGYAAGGNKFDLTIWNEAHLARLKDFVAQAGKRGIVVEMNLFTPYRIQGWEFILAGGGLYNNLDYSFTVDHPDGTFVPPESTPGGGSPALRSQLKILKEFIHGFNFVKMAPNDVVIKGGLPSGAMARALVEAGKAYAIYIHHGTPGYSHNASPPQSARSPYAVQTGKQQLTLRLDIPRGGYRAEWVNTKTGHIDKAENFNHPGGNKTLVSPTYSEDIALRVKEVAPGN